MRIAAVGGTGPIGSKTVPISALGYSAGGPVSRWGLGAEADQARVLRAEPGRDVALDVGDDERVAAPCADSVTWTRNSNSLFACRWLRAPDLNQRSPKEILTLGSPSLRDSPDLSRHDSGRRSRR